MSAAPERPEILRELRWVATQPDVQSIGIHTSSAGGQGVIGVSPRALVAFLDWVAALEAQRDAARERERRALVNLRQLEWDADTDAHQCAWCLGWQQHGHLNDCKFAALLVAALGDVLHG